MKNQLRMTLLAVLAMGLAIPCFADQAQGLVDSIDATTHSIRIVDPVSGSGKTLRVHPKVISKVKPGSVVKATFRSNSNQADTLEVLDSR